MDFCFAKLVKLIEFTKKQNCLVKLWRFLDRQQAVNYCNFTTQLPIKFMQLFYNSEINKNTSLFTFDKEESRHIVRVLRKKESDLIHLTNGKGFLFEGEIISASEKKCEVKIIRMTVTNGFWKKQPKSGFTKSLRLSVNTLNGKK
jgi:hypothetical protein